MKQAITTPVETTLEKDNKIRIPPDILENTDLTTETKGKWIAADTFTAENPHDDDKVLALLTKDFEVIVPTTVFYSNATIDANGHVDQDPDFTHFGDKFMWFTPITFEGIRVPAMAVLKEEHLKGWMNHYFHPAPSEWYVYWARDDLDGGMMVPA